jgi:hypothetical protein
MVLKVRFTCEKALTRLLSVSSSKRRDKEDAIMSSLPEL